MSEGFKIEKGRIFNHRDGMSELKIFEEQLKEKDMEQNSASTNHGIDDTSFGLTNSGADVVQVPVESKEPTLESTPSEVGKVEKKKRGRPRKKEEKEVRQFRCSTCRELIAETSIMKIGAGNSRYAAFCPMCQRSLGFVDDVMQQTIKDLIDNNPTGK